MRSVRSSRVHQVSDWGGWPSTIKVNTLAYLAQHLVVLLDENAIVSGLQVAHTHPVFQTARDAVFHTGPSATADIEGVLIEGAQGVRSLMVIVDG
jgi:L-lactate dehydrogenase complex protein LldG